MDKCSWWRACNTKNKPTNHSTRLQADVWREDWPNSEVEHRRREYGRNECCWEESECEVFNRLHAELSLCADSAMLAMFEAMLMEIRVCFSKASNCETVNRVLHLFLVAK